MVRPLTPEMIRDPGLPKARRGFEEGATQDHLNAAAAAFAEAIRARDDLLRQVEALKKQVEETPTDAETIGAVLMVAHRAAEELLAKAGDEAAEIHAGAERRRDELLVEARAQIEAMVADAGTGIQALRDQDANLRRSIATHRQELAHFLRTSLAQLEGVQLEGVDSVETTAPTPPQAMDGELFLRLPSE